MAGSRMGSGEVVAFKRRPPPSLQRSLPSRHPDGLETDCREEERKQKSCEGAAWSGVGPQAL